MNNLFENKSNNSNSLNNKFLTTMAPKLDTLNTNRENC